MLEARRKLVLTTQSASERATRDVVQTAVDTGREIDSVAKLYEKAARAAQQFGIIKATLPESPEDSRFRSAFVRCEHAGSVRRHGSVQSSPRVWPTAR